MMLTGTGDLTSSPKEVLEARRADVSASAELEGAGCRGPPRFASGSERMGMNDIRAQSARMSFRLCRLVSRFAFVESVEALPGQLEHLVLEQPRTFA